MKLFATINAAVLAVGLSAGGQAWAMPAGANPSVSDDLVIKVQQDCHADVRRHYLSQYGKRVWHRHRQSNCRVVLADPPRQDDGGRRDCHRDVRRHFIPEYGRSVTHRHVGQRCRVQELRRNYNARPGGSCIRIGPITYCEN